MIDYTRVAIAKTVDDVKRFAYFFNIAVQLLSLAYLIYAIAVGAGIVYFNVIFLALTAGYLLFYLVTHGDVEKKKTRASVQKAYRLIKLAVKTAALGIAVYGVYIAVEHTTLVSITMTALNIVGWTLQVTVSLAVSFVENKISFIATAVEADIEDALRPVEKVGSFIKRVGGKPTEEKEAPDKRRAALDEAVFEYREKKRREREERKNARWESLKRKIKIPFQVKRKKKAPEQEPVQTDIYAEAEKTEETANTK